MYSMLDVRYLDVPVTSPRTAASTTKFYAIQDRFFLALGTDSIAAMNPDVAILAEIGLIKDQGVVTLFEADSLGVPLTDEDGEVRDGLVAVDEHDHDAGLEALLKYLNETW